MWERPSDDDAPASTDEEKVASRNEFEEKELEGKGMTLDQYEKILEEKRTALQAIKTNIRKDKMELAKKVERAKKSISINEFLKPADGEGFYYPSCGRGHGSYSDSPQNDNSYDLVGFSEAATEVASAMETEEK